MKKIICLTVLFIAFIPGVNAQPGQLIIKKGNQGLYLDHIVAPKEGLYSIGRLYNVHPKFIAAYNKIELTGLNIGQVIQVPLTDTNFTQQSTSGVPVYYSPESNKSLTEISNASNKVDVQKLRSWNNLSGDNVAAGKKIIVGFLVSKEMAAVAANNLVKEQVSKQESKSVAPAEQKEVKLTGPVETQNQNQKPPTTDKALTASQASEMTEQVKQQPQKTEPAFATENIMSGGEEQGYFKKSYEQQIRMTPVSKNETVTAGIFKTTSGWQDAKYYLLIDKVPSGTIIKIINPENNKAIYAKVLGEMNGIRQNLGLNIRISNAASAALGISDTEKFIVKLNY